MTVMEKPVSYPAEWWNLTEDDLPNGGWSANTHRGPCAADGSFYFLLTASPAAPCSSRAAVTERMMRSGWLECGRHLAAIAQNGLAFARDPYDVERYQAIREVAAEILASGSDLEPDQMVQLLAPESGYATPKVDVRGAVFRDNTILLVKEREDGLWTLPGGWADIGQSPAEAVVREVQEESGYQTRAVKLLAVYDREKHGHPPHLHHIYKLFFQCDLIGGEALSSIETEDAAFFPEDQLPDLSLTRVMPSQIFRLFEHSRHPDWPTDFD